MLRGVHGQFCQFDRNEPQVCSNKRSMNNDTPWEGYNRGGYVRLAPHSRLAESGSNDFRSLWALSQLQSKGVQGGIERVREGCQPIRSRGSRGGVR